MSLFFILTPERFILRKLFINFMCDECCCCCNKVENKLRCIFSSHLHFDKVAEYVLTNTDEATIWFKGETQFIDDKYFEQLHKKGFYVTEIHRVQGHYLTIHVKRC